MSLARTLAAIWLAALLLALPAAAAERASLPDIEDEVMCPVCGTLLELSESPQAERERAFIRDLIDRGRTKEEIKDALVAEYGEGVLATPSGEGFDLSAWIVPALGLLALGSGLALALWRTRGRHEPDDEPDGGSHSPEDEARLERDMSLYDRLR